MNVVAEPFWVQKHGNTLEEYEDAAFPVERREYEQPCVQLAVADGATESMFAGRWAKQLVNAVGDGELSLRRPAEGIAQLRASWREWLFGQPLPWYAEEKARQGAFAAFLALELTADLSDYQTDGSWYAAAVGDSCLFQIRNGVVITRFPLNSADAFDSRPVLLASLGAADTGVAEATLSGTWHSGDWFLLMTDALACWFIQHLDAGGGLDLVEGDFGFPTEPRPYAAWVDSLRQTRSIRNDDCTLLRVQVR